MIDTLCHLCVTYPLSFIFPCLPLVWPQNSVLCSLIPRTLTSMLCLTLRLVLGIPQHTTHSRHLPGTPGPPAQLFQGDGLWEHFGWSDDSAGLVRSDSEEGSLAQGMPRNLLMARAGKKTFIVSRGKNVPFSERGGFSVRSWDSRQQVLEVDPEGVWGVR